MRVGMGWRRKTTSTAGIGTGPFSAVRGHRFRVGIARARSGSTSRNGGNAPVARWQERLEVLLIETSITAKDEIHAANLVITNSFTPIAFENPS